MKFMNFKFNLKKILLPKTNIQKKKIKRRCSSPFSENFLSVSEKKISKKKKCFKCFGQKNES
jgi:hypothetical protein